jgi:hypothetical protein
LAHSITREKSHLAGGFLSTGSLVLATSHAYNARMDKKPPATNTRIRNIFLSVAAALFVAGWLAILALRPLYFARPLIYSVAGAIALTASGAGGLMFSWIDRRWPSPKK